MQHSSHHNSTADKSLNSGPSTFTNVSQASHSKLEPGVHDETPKESRSGNRPRRNKNFCLRAVTSGYTIFSHTFIIIVSCKSVYYLL